jgi:hypothetical protein
VSGDTLSKIVRAWTVTEGMTKGVHVCRNETGFSAHRGLLRFGLPCRRLRAVSDSG